MMLSSQPGEVQHEKGRDRARLFAGCLQQIVDGFRAEFFVSTTPEKLEVSFSNRKFSFDILGRLNNGVSDCEVWIEAKGYDKASDLLEHYRSFVRRVALARLHHDRMKNDVFWFVSSSPFACSDGSDISTSKWMRSTIRESVDQKAVSIDPGEIDEIENLGFEALARSIRVLFLTAELMKTTGLKQRALQGENLWTMTQQLYGGVVPVLEYRSYADSVASTNNIPDPNLIYSGQNIWLPFLGWPDCHAED